MKRSAFTLVELLVVIAVVALLVAILVPAMYGARMTARTTQCISRQRDLALAMITYSNTNNGLPGYLNELGTTPIHPWTVAVFPMLGENKRYDVLMNLKKDETPPAAAIASLPVLICPASNPEGIARLNYVVNCGPVEEGNINGDTAPAFTLFKDRRSELTTINRKVKIEEIPDGTSNTILLSENLNAGFWHRHSDQKNGRDFGWHYWTNDSGKEPQIPEGDRELKQASPDANGKDVFTRDKISTGFLGFIWSAQRDNKYAPNSPTPPPTGERPTSLHPGAVVAAYADGVAKKVNDDISMENWLQAVCPDDEKLKETLKEL